MLIKRFKKFSPLTVILLLLAGLLLWADAFMSDHAVAEVINPALFYQLLQPLILRFPLTASILAFAFIMIQALVLNQSMINRGMLDRHSLMVSLMYVILMGSHVSLTVLHPVVFSNFFLILALHRIWLVYEEEEVIKEVFNVGLLTAMAGLFFYPALIFLLLNISCLFVFYVISSRSLLAAFIGFGTPFGFTALYYFMTDQLAERWDKMSFSLFYLNWWEAEFPLPEKLFVVFIALLALLALFRLLFSFLPDKPIRMRKRYMVVVHYFFIGAISLVFSGVHFFYHIGLLAVSLSILLAFFFQHQGRRWVAEVFFVILLALIIAMRLAMAGVL